jgi:hypothetical protein
MGNSMHHAPRWNTGPDQPVPADAGAIVEAYLTLLMKPDPEAARRLAGPDLSIRFTGGRHMNDPAQCAEFNRSRYARVHKKFEATEVVAGATPQHAVVYNRGTLFGEWLDGTPFEGNRYVDRYVVAHGLIVEMDVWNDSAEWLLVRAGLAEQ